MSDLLEKYRAVAGTNAIHELEQISALIKGIKILHINSTKQGGGVAEILTWMIPLCQALGIETDWQVLNGNSEFYECTKSFHNGLQGRPIAMPSQKLLSNFESINRDNSDQLRSMIEHADIVFIHDPQPAPLIKFFPHRKNRWIWRCHIDLSNPHRGIWRYLRDFVKDYDASIFSLADFVQPLPKPVYLIPPSIDPLSEKNIDLPLNEVDEIYDRFEINKKYPFILQVSRFDQFKDPIGVIEAYKISKKYKPNLQLVLAGGGAPDDPEGEQVLKEVKKYAKGDSDIHILFLPSDSHRTVNALQRAAEIVLQKSTKEGFGLTVTEALWKSKPVIGGNTGGIRLQVVNHHTGYLVNTPEGAANRIRYLLQNPKVRDELGQKGHQFVHENFLITRHLRDYLTLIISILHNQQDRIELQKFKNHNP